MTMTPAVPWRPAATRPEAQRALHQVGTALWTMFHAQALLDGGPASGNDAAMIEDDRRRLSQRRSG
jgi:hypothetical protein